MKNNKKIKKPTHKKKEAESNTPKLKISKYFYLISGIIFLFTALYWTAIHNSCYLLKVQKLSLFLPGKYFFADFIKYPGGLLAYAGTFLTQFFYSPWLGSVIYLLLLLVLAFLFKTTFNINRKNGSLIFIPSLLLLLSFSQLGYLIYINKTPDIAYANLIGAIVTISGFEIYKLLFNKEIKIIYVLLFIVLFYPIAGFYAVLAGIMIAINELVSCLNTKRKNGIIVFLSTLCGSILIPVFYYRFIYIHLNPGSIFTSGLPYFLTDEKEIALWIPLFMLVLTFIVATILSASKKKRSFLPEKYHPAISLAVFLLCCLYVFKVSYNDENFRTEIKMSDAIFDNNWDEVLKQAESAKIEPSRMMVIMTNLALQKTGTAGDKMFTFEHGDRHYNTTEKVSAIRIAGVPVYYHYGFINYAYRWAMENTTEFGMNIETLQYLVKTAVFNSEYALAQKYNDVLKNTLFYKDWAEDYQKYIDSPEAILELPEYESIKDLCIYNDNILGGDRSLLEHCLLYSIAEIDKGTVPMLEISLQCNLILRNIENFWPRFFFYINNHETIPVHYQEAAILYAYVEKKVDISNIEFDSYVMKRFNEAIKTAQQYKDSEDMAKKVFKKRFGDTFWYYYFFQNDLTFE